MTGHIAPAQRCSVQWRADDLPAWGTASRADFWVALEQPGPWGAKALTESHLDPELGQHLETLCSEAGGRAVLIRRPGRHADVGEGPFTVLVSGGLLAGTPWLGSTRLGSHYDIVELLQLGDDLARGPRPEWLDEAEPVVAVCTNARRDQCCALSGRELLADFEGHPGFWEVSHLGGHRFAPTALVLPTGQALARLDPLRTADAVAAVRSGRPLAAGPRHDRGLSHLPNHLQVADAWARWQGLESTAMHAEELDEPGDQAWLVNVAGRRVRVTKQVGPDELPSSCGKGLDAVVRWQLTEMD
ncbi:sucrase ferredoxin [Aestuariimicrobium sp. Y1814]|uniref:sucrase ferredoxin n=1 Tax=Aestuariimicrobium sp. Y1814 TaxID=3418742 RepID=UPI003DA7470B